MSLVDQLLLGLLLMVSLTIVGLMARLYSRTPKKDKIDQKNNESTSIEHEKTEGE
ncbi:hypothetical protein GF326_12710 [Candidatus Bathyarchaeota archaeon]|nr:hypothetical protein [Candidatus Bathyarchaeota archaeon]